MRPRDGGGNWKKLGEISTDDLSAGFWSKDGKTIYFNEGVRATNQFIPVFDRDGQSHATDAREGGAVQPSRRRYKHDLINYSDP